MTQKSLTELSELLRSEELAYKKCCNYVADANNHKHRFDTLLGYLENAR